MYAELKTHAPCCCAFRWPARIASVMLFGGWLIFLLAEDLVPKSQYPLIVLPQGISLAVIFIGYAIAWKHELIGSVVALAGVIAFYIACLATQELLPPVGFLVFAIPSLLYLVSWRLDDRHSREIDTDRSSASG